MTSTAPARPSLYRWPIRLLAVLIVGVVVYRAANTSQTGAASNFHQLQDFPPRDVPPFVLTERSGRNITNHDLAGKIWVADFIYTTCPGPCPLITASMAKVQDAVAHDPRVQLVTFTVDPTTDTPAVLSAYADKFGADPYRWWFLTGQEKPVYDLIQNGFYQVVQDNRDKPPQDGQFQVTHSTRMALVDGYGRIRGFYDGVGSDGRDSLLHDIKIIEEEQ